MKGVWMTAAPMAKVRPGVVLFVYGAWGLPNIAGPPELRPQSIAVDRGGLRPAASRRRPCNWFSELGAWEMAPHREMETGAGRGNSCLWSNVVKCA